MTLLVSLVSVILWSLAVILTVGRKRPSLEASMQARAEELVTLIVPARNEEQVIARCVKSLLAQDYLNLEIIIVDDHSTDHTARKVEELAAETKSLKLLANPEFEPGWVGKTSACFHGARNSRGNWLLFVDADTVLSPGAVSSAVGFALAAGLDALSLMPRVEPTGFASRFMFPVIGYLIRTFYPMQGVNSGKGRAFFYGGFTLFRAEAYMRIGGHAAVRGEVVEDKALGELAQRSGLKIMVMAGRNLVSSRVGGTTHREMWYSVQRVVSAAFRARRVEAILFSILLPLFFFLPYISLITAFYLGDLISLILALASLLAYFLTIYVDVSIDQDANPLYALLTPVGSLLIGVSAMQWAVFNPQLVAWRGRNYRISS